MNALIRQPIIGNDITNLSRCSPNAFELKVTPYSRGGRKYLHYAGSDALVGSILPGVITASHLIDKQIFEKATGTGTETWVRSWMAMMPVAIDWGCKTNVLSEVASRSGLVVPTLGQGVTFGTCHNSMYCADYHFNAGLLLTDAEL